MWFPARCESVTLDPDLHNRGYAFLSIHFVHGEITPIAEKVVEEFQRKTEMNDLELSFSPFQPGYITHPPFMEEAFYKVSKRGTGILFQMPTDASEDWGSYLNIMMSKKLPLNTAEFLDEFAQNQLKPEEPYEALARVPASSA